MNRPIPVMNKILAKKWEERTQYIHEKHLQSMKPSVNSTCPPTYNHLKKKAKREMLLKEWKADVNKKNLMLREKLLTIMLAKTPKAEMFTKDSLNSVFRKDQLKNINSENQALLRRLQQRMPHYSVAKWAKEFREEERRAKLISQMPQKTETTQKKHPVRHLKSLSKTIRSRKSPKHIESDLVYRGETVISNLSISVEIYQLLHKFQVKLVDLNSSDVFTINLEEDIVKHILSSSQDYQLLLSMLEIQDDALVLQMFPNIVDDFPQTFSTGEEKPENIEIVQQIEDDGPQIVNTGEDKSENIEIVREIEDDVPQKVNMGEEKPDNIEIVQENEDDVPQKVNMGEEKPENIEIVQENEDDVPQIVKTGEEKPENIEIVQEIEDDAPQTVNMGEEKPDNIEIVQKNEDE